MNKNRNVKKLASQILFQRKTVRISVEELRAEIDNTAGGEDRARKQLVKLQVIMNQMQVKIRKYKLPSISQQYEEDMAKANEYIHSIDRLINAPTLNVQLLSSTLKEAIDFIYKLYNNVNNVVATVIMVCRLPLRRSRRFIRGTMRI